MSTILQRRLAEFVDREHEMARYCEMLDTGDPPIMVAWGDTGLGKSSLLAKMIHECSRRQLRKAEIVWTDSRAYNYLAVMRKIRDDLGSNAFKPFTDLVQYFTVPQYKLQITVQTGGSISVAENAKFENAQVGDIAAVIIKDAMFTVPRHDMAVPEAELLMRLTDRFISDLRTAIGDKRIVISLDAVEKASEDTRKWLWDELLAAARDGRLTNCTFVLCTQGAPQLSHDWRGCVEQSEIRPLEHQHIVAYLEKRGIEEAIRGALASMLLAKTEGRIGEIAEMVDSFERVEAQLKRK